MKQSWAAHSKRWPARIHQLENKSNASVVSVGLYGAMPRKATEWMSVRPKYLQLVCIFSFARSRCPRSFAATVKTPISIPRAALALLVALLYLATSAPAAVHGPTHAQRESSHCAAMEHSGESSEAGSSGCFYCHHGPAVAIVGAPKAPASPSTAYEAYLPARATEEISALRAPFASLRAPPFRS